MMAGVGVRVSVGVGVRVSVGAGVFDGRGSGVCVDSEGKAVSRVSLGSGVAGGPICAQPTNSNGTPKMSNLLKLHRIFFM
jgi:hypothetical protein